MLSAQRGCGYYSNPDLSSNLIINALRKLCTLIRLYCAVNRNFLQLRLLENWSRATIQFRCNYTEMSFVEVPPNCHFPIQNLPYGVFSTRDEVKDHVT